MANVDLNALYVANDAENNDSRKTMIYTRDDGKTVLVNISEAIGEAFGFDDFTAASNPDFTSDKGLTMRTVTGSDSTGKIKVKYPCGKPNTPIYAEGGLITVPRKGKAAGVTVAVTGAQGEKRRILSPNDTGQQNGDNT